MSSDVMGNRFRLFLLSVNDLPDLIFARERGCDWYRPGKIADRLPEDARIVGAGVFDAGTVALRVWHHSFPEVPPGDALPRADLRRASEHPITRPVVRARTDTPQLLPLPPCTAPLTLSDPDADRPTIVLEDADS